MIRETELNLFVPSPELLVRLASGDRPLGIRAGPPHIKSLRETFFDTPDQALRRRGMTCKLRQVEGEEVGHVEYTREEYEHLRRYCEEHGLTFRGLILRHMASEGYRVGGEDS